VVFETESALSGLIRVVDQGDERRLVAGGHTLSAISLSGNWSSLKGEYWCRALDMVERRAALRRSSSGWAVARSLMLLAARARPRSMTAWSATP
jgi:hypothetical protein